MIPCAMLIMPQMKIIKSFAKQSAVYVVQKEVSFEDNAIITTEGTQLVLTRCERKLLKNKFEHFLKVV